LKIISKSSTKKQKRLLESSLTPRFCLVDYKSEYLGVCMAPKGKLYTQTTLALRDFFTQMMALKILTDWFDSFTALSLP